MRTDFSFKLISISLCAADLFVYLYTNRDIFPFCAGIAIIVSLTVCQTPCSEENRLVDLEACLQAIRDAMQDNSLFFFGSSYLEKYVSLFLV